MTIGPAVNGREMEQVRASMREYGAHLAAGSARAAPLCIPDYEAELRGLPGVYAGPEGVLLLATRDDEAAGCVAVRPARVAGERACELKRLWVGTGFRGLGLGRRLMEAAVDWARQAGYGAVYLDTVPAAMPEANGLYKRMGFERVERYNDNPVADVVFYRLGL